ncbi:MAG: histidine kinase [Verrucomicrobia bacterium]|nr:MAG: histidine kinase [Verrucomicrobiota bacterium]
MKAKSVVKDSGAKRSTAKRAKQSAAVQRRRSRTQPATKSFPVVGIGASAGGYEAFTKFLEKLPEDSGMAFVLVQHLDPKHESKLTELLSRITRLPVTEVQQAVTVQPDHVYVIPPNKNLVIAGGSLKLVPRRMTDMPPMPIDFFLRSLAEDQRQNAIGVIFSGNGSDGTLGLEAIKGSDGITFAQDPKTAKVTGMPESAIASGCVDFVLPPDQIARELAKLPHHPYIASPPPEKGTEAAKPSQPLAKIYSLLRAARGVDFAPYKQSTLNRRILRRMVVHRTEKLEEYVRFLHTHPAEVEALFDDILIAVTRFFRDPKSFRVLMKKVFPALIKDRSRELPIRVWVPGCSSGEEAYSIAMGLAEFLGNRATHYPIQIFGTDISEIAIAKARAGVYRANIAQDVSPERLRRFFTPVEEGYRIAKAIRDLCVFARQNLGADPPFSKMDLLSCQNVLIYFGPELQKRVIPVFHYALQPNGFLLLGPAEGIGGFSDLFTQVDKKQRLYVKTSPLAQPEVAFSAKVFDEQTPALTAAPPATPQPLLPNIEKTADQVLLHHYRPSGVVIDSKMQVLQFRGYTASYLEHAPGVASLNLLKMVRDDLVVPLRTAISKGLKDHRPVHKEIAWKKTKDQKRHLKLEVIPFKTPPAKEPFLLVLFEEGRLLEAPGVNTARPGRTRAGKERRSAEELDVRFLHEELESARESFQAAVEEQEATNEELKSANEEAQSSNEELQSTNEELETAKEEMQSTNEELATVNEELRNANQAANRVNNDLLNLLASIQIPVVMVDNNLTVRRFTPAAQKFFNLIPTDVGRSLNDIKMNFDVTGLEEMIKEVLDTLHIKESQTRDRSGHWYSLRIRPYRTKDNKIDGAVLALFDIHEFKRGIEEISETMWEPVLALDSELRVAKVNEAFYEKFRVTPEETEGQYIYDLGNGQWNIPRLRSLLEEVLPEKARIKDFAVEHDFPKLGPRKMLVSARRLDMDESKQEMILLAFRDVTAEKTGG